jgi:hypothetical protein
VNHGQVASGTMPETVVDNDIDAELEEEEAHRCVQYTVHIHILYTFSPQSIVYCTS